MKKILSTLFSLLFITASTCINFAYASEKGCGWEVKHKKNVVSCSGVNCLSDINISEAIFDGVDQYGKENYRKKVEVRSDFYLLDNNEYISGNLLCFYFVYNNSKVTLEKDGIMKDETYSFNKYWKTTSSEEVYESPQQCIVSQRVGIYDRDTSLQNLENKDEFHIDIMCSVTGEVSFNIKSIEGPKRVDERLSDPVIRIEKIKKNLVREISERDREYANDLKNTDNDRYRYITREIHIKYKNEEGDLLADALIEANFRYNIETHEVQCLSTFNEEKNGEIDVNMRTGNETRTYAGAYGEIKLKYLSGSSKKSFKESIIVKCDSRGVILTQFMR